MLRARGSDVVCDPRVCWSVTAAGTTTSPATGDARASGGPCGTRTILGWRVVRGRRIGLGMRRWRPAGLWGLVLDLMRLELPVLNTVRRVGMLTLTTGLRVMTSQYLMVLAPVLALGLPVGPLGFALRRLGLL